MASTQSSNDNNDDILAPKRRRNEDFISSKGDRTQFVNRQKKRLDTIASTTFKKTKAIVFSIVYDNGTLYFSGPEQVEGATNLLQQCLDEKQLVVGLSASLGPGVSNPVPSMQMEAHSDIPKDPDLRYIDQMRVLITQAVKETHPNLSQKKRWLPQNRPIWWPINLPYANVSNTLDYSKIDLSPEEIETRKQFQAHAFRFVEKDLKNILTSRNLYQNPVLLSFKDLLKNDSYEECLKWLQENFDSLSEESSHDILNCVTLPDLITATIQNQHIIKESWAEGFAAKFSLVPEECQADGNCGFRAISRLLFGTQDYFMILRIITCVLAVIHKSHVMKELSGSNVILHYLPDHVSGEDVGDTYNKEVQHTCVNTSYIGPLQFKLLASHFSKAFRIYVYHNSSCNESYLIDGCCKLQDLQSTLNVLLGPLNGNGRLSHFMPLLPKSDAAVNYTQDSNLASFCTANATELCLQQDGAQASIQCNSCGGLTHPICVGLVELHLDQYICCSYDDSELGEWGRKIVLKFPKSSDYCAKISVADVLRLRAKKMITSSVIDFYCLFLAEKHKEGLLLTNSFFKSFCSKSEKDRGLVNSIQAATMVCDDFPAFISVPVSYKSGRIEDEHWFLLVCETKKEGQVWLLDSVYGNIEELHKTHINQFRRLVDWMSRQLNFKIKASLCCKVAEVPLQVEGADSGMYLLKNLEEVCLGFDLQFFIRECYLEECILNMRCQIRKEVYNLQLQELAK